MSHEDMAILQRCTRSYAWNYPERFSHHYHGRTAPTRRIAARMTTTQILYHPSQHKRPASMKTQARQPLPVVVDSEVTFLRLVVAAITAALPPKLRLCLLLVHLSTLHLLLISANLLIQQPIIHNARPTYFTEKSRECHYEHSCAAFCRTRTSRRVMLWRSS